MKAITTLFLMVLFLTSCTKDSLSCSRKRLIGTYYSHQLNHKIKIYSESKDELRIDLPRIGKFNFYHLYIELEQDGCNFTLSHFYDNYGTTANGSHYWLRGEGGGRIERKGISLDYHVLITETYPSWPASVVKVDSTFSSFYLKQ